MRNSSIEGNIDENTDQYGVIIHVDHTIMKVFNTLMTKMKNCWCTDD